VIGSHSINGVAELHSTLVRERVLADFADMWPERFNNKTNGVTPRRWLQLCNPGLAAAIRRRIGDGWLTDLDQLSNLEPFVDDAGFLAELRDVKRANKQALARIIRERHGLTVDPDSLFDVQVKRIHEYKRQLLNCLHVIHLYRRLKFDGATDDIIARTVLMGGKAAPGYATAKKHIKLINDVAVIVNSDRSLKNRLKCLFLANYNVSLAERIIPAADLSQQISMAGKEASGTGNMKFQMNGALTLGTLDGANVEIRQEVGEDNFFLFGHDAERVRELKLKGYHPREYIDKSPALRNVIEMIRAGIFSPDEPSLHADVVDYLCNHDPYLICADFDAYIAAHEQAAQIYSEPARWDAMVARNIARAGKFSSDRAIRQYASEIWDATPVHIELEPYTSPESRDRPDG